MMRIEYEMNLLCIATSSGFRHFALNFTEPSATPDKPARALLPACADGEAGTEAKKKPSSQANVEGEK
jgi:hypothetical protein